MVEQIFMIKTWTGRRNTGDGDFNGLTTSSKDKGMLQDIIRKE